MSWDLRGESRECDFRGDLGILFSSSDSDQLFEFEDLRLCFGECGVLAETPGTLCSSSLNNIGKGLGGAGASSTTAFRDVAA